MSEWRPIETAPKTSEELRELYGPDRLEYQIIVGRPDQPTDDEFTVLAGCVAVAHYENGRWLAITDLEFPGEFGKYYEVLEPTRWMPLPDLPK